MSAPLSLLVMQSQRLRRLAASRLPALRACEPGRGPLVDHSVLELGEAARHPIEANKNERRELLARRC